jgi:hypothetical protein
MKLEFYQRLQDQGWIGTCDKFPNLTHLEKTLREALGGIAGQALQSIHDSKQESRVE